MDKGVSFYRNCGAALEVLSTDLITKGNLGCAMGTVWGVAQSKIRGPRGPDSRIPGH